MPRINLTTEELSAIEPVLQSFRTAQSLKAERLRTLLAMRQAFGSSPTDPNLPLFSFNDIQNTLSIVEQSL